MCTVSGRQKNSYLSTPRKTIFSQASLCHKTIGSQLKNSHFKTLRSFSYLFLNGFWECKLCELMPYLGMRKETDIFSLGCVSAEICANCTWSLLNRLSFLRLQMRNRTIKRSWRMWGHRLGSHVKWSAKPQLSPGHHTDPLKPQECWKASTWGKTIHMLIP